MHNIHAGPFEGLTKGELPGQLCVFAREVLRTEAAMPLGHYDVVHSHYWLSGQVGALARDRWGVPLVHSMHTMAKVKNDAIALGDTPEPAARIIGEEQVVEAADMLIASTDIEAKQLVNLYDADPGRVEVVHPGVDLTVFRPRDAVAAREQLGLPQDAHVVLFAGRLQPLKAPDVLLRAVSLLLDETPDAALAAGRPGRRRAVRHGAGAPGARWRSWPPSSRIDDVVRFVPPVPPAELAVWDAAASVVAVPSYNESFGLVAAEAQAGRDPGHRGCRRRPDHRGGRRRERPAARQPRARPSGPVRCAGCCSTTRCAARLSAGARDTAGHVLVGGDRRAHP